MPIRRSVTNAVNSCATPATPPAEIHTRRAPLSLHLMHPDTTDLNLLMVHADDRDPVLPDGLPDQAARAQGATEKTGSATHLWDEGGDPNDLAAQRWGVIAPQGPEGDRLLALIDPLMRLRREQQGGDPIRVYRVPPQMTQSEAMRWKKREFDTGADLNLEVPRYQLILGDLDQVPLTLQQVQQSDGYVGRLAQDSDDEYAAYVDKVLRYERQVAASVEHRARSLFFTVHDGTAATTAGHRALIGPGVEVVRKRQAAGQYNAKEILEFGDRVTPSPDELMAHVGERDPGVLFTLSHGEGAPRGGWRSHAEQRRRQGAMSFGREGHIVADELRARPFMPGGLWFMLACYGGGTPSASAYKHWLEALQAVGQFRGRVESVLAGLPGPGDRPFIAALPKAVLANSDGPLAFMGHIDLAWTYSFQELDSGATNRPARFMAITRSLLKRDRCGVSLRELTRFFDQTNIELTSLYDQEAQARSMGIAHNVDAARQGHLWMLRQDLSAYVLLGDPAVRLPSGEEAPVATPRPIEVHTHAPTASPSSAPANLSVDLMGGFPPQASQAAASAPVAVDAIEEALAAVRTLEAIAARTGLSRAELERRVAVYRDAGRRAL